VVAWAAQPAQPTLLLTGPIDPGIPPTRHDHHSLQTLG
jgi:hypothetical protein